MSQSQPYTAKRVRNRLFCLKPLKQVPHMSRQSIEPCSGSLSQCSRLPRSYLTSHVISFAPEAPAKPLFRFALLAFALIRRSHQAESEHAKKPSTVLNHTCQTTESPTTMVFSSYEVSRDPARVRTFAAPLPIHVNLLQSHLAIARAVVSIFAS
jgi:hypothetical protein